MPPPTAGEGNVTFIQLRPARATFLRQTLEFQLDNSDNTRLRQWRRQGSWTQTPCQQRPPLINRRLEGTKPALPTVATLEQIRGTCVLILVLELNPQCGGLASHQSSRDDTIPNGN